MAKNPKVFLEVTHIRQVLGRIEIELFADLVPQTAENFRQLCIGKEGTDLNYKNTPFHRVVKNFIVQGGDTTEGDGSGGMSIYGRKFKDENFIASHSCAGVVSMANCGPNTNCSQFFITLRATPHLDKRHVVVGRVTKGMDIVKQIEQIPVDKRDKPKEKVFISNCGEVKDNEENGESQSEQQKAVILTEEELKKLEEERRRKEMEESAEILQQSVQLGLSRTEKRKKEREDDCSKIIKKGGMMDVYGVDESDEDEDEDNTVPEK